MNDDELRKWQEIDHHLSELTKHAGWGALVEYAHFYLMAGPKHRLLNGNVGDWDTYNKDTGRLTGIHDIIDAPKVVKKKVDEEIERRREISEPGLAEV